MLIKDMANALVNTPADYKKSVISRQTGEKIEKPPYKVRILTRDDIVKQQLLLASQAVKNINKDLIGGKFPEGEQEEHLQRVTMKVNELSNMIENLSQQASSPTRSRTRSPARL